MRFGRLFVAVVLLGVAFLAGCQGVNNSGSSSPLPVPASSPSGQVLYVLNDGTVSTYSIDLNTLEPFPAGTPIALIASGSSLMQLVPSADDHFLYALWLDAAQIEHLSVYGTDDWGNPQLPALQTLDANGFAGLNLHPSGKFAYAMQVAESGGMYTSTILLFNVQASGVLGPMQPQGQYGPSMMPTLLYGLNPSGTELYLESQDVNASEYWERTVSGRNGTLAPDILVLSPPMMDSVLFGATLIVAYQSAMDCSSPRYVSVMANEPEPPEPLVQCGSAMLSACGMASNVQIDPSGKYLFLTDPESQKVEVVGINLEKNALTDSGNFLPFTAETPGFAFSPDGTLVYAWLASDNNLHIFQFKTASGKVTEGATSIPMPAGGGFLTAERR